MPGAFNWTFTDERVEIALALALVDLLPLAADESVMSPRVSAFAQISVPYYASPIRLTSRPATWPSLNDLTTPGD